MIPPMGDSPVRYATIRALRDGETVDFEGVAVKAAEDQELRPGRTYIAERNTGPHLLTVMQHVVENNLVGGYVIATERAYPFDASECVVVDLLLDESAA